MHEIELNYWASASCIAFITFIVNTVTLYKELKKRKLEKIKFTNNSQKIWSLICLITGVTYGFFESAQFLNWLCYFSYQMGSASFIFQATSMGFYQLNRLYSCFARTQIYSNNGYPNYVFIIMYLIGIILIIITFIVRIIWYSTFITKDCGIKINDNYQYFQIFSQSQQQSQSFQFFGIITGIIAFIYLLWDWITLCLYIIKVISFKKYKSGDINIYKRIMSILNRILILTVMYEITVPIYITIAVICGISNNTIFWVLWTIASGLWSIVMSYSMFLMQQHNIKQYKWFINLLYQSRLYHICCCCKSIIIYETEKDSIQHCAKGNNHNSELAIFKAGTIEINKTMTTMTTSTDSSTPHSVRYESRATNISTFTKYSQKQDSNAHAKEIGINHDQKETCCSTCC